VSRLESIARFVWDFVVGDDWRIAVVVVAALAATALVSTTSVSAWWIMPAAVAVVLAGSVFAALRARH
jgi:hypothetical protein